MSFFSKMEGMFKDDKKGGQLGQPDGQRGYEQQQYGYQQSPQQGYVPPQPQYNTYPQQYSSPPPAQQYSATAGPPPPPQLPQGWMPLWDPAGQRWAFLELSVSKVIWTMPTGPSYPPQGGYPPQLGGSFPPQGAPEYGTGQDTRGYGSAPGGLDQGNPAKDNSNRNMMLGAAAGVAVGAVGAALITNAIDDDHYSDREEERYEEEYGSD